MFYAFLLSPSPLATIMESSQIIESTEEYSGISGSESGWTTYIASSVQEDNLDDDGADNHSTNKHGDYRRGSCYSDDDDDDDSESNDSMASDASSGPSHHDLPWKSNEGNLGGTGYPLKHAITKNSSKEKLHEQVVKQRDGARMKVEKEESVVLKEKGAASTSRVQSSTKVRKPN